MRRRNSFFRREMSGSLRQFESGRRKAESGNFRRRKPARRTTNFSSTSRWKKRAAWRRSKRRHGGWSGRRFCRRTSARLWIWKRWRISGIRGRRENPRATAEFGEARIAVHGEIQLRRNWRKSSGQGAKPGWKMNLSSCKAWRIWSCCCRRKSGWWISRRIKLARTNWPQKTKLYTPQLKLYAAALAKIYSRPVTNGWLHFLAARKTVKVKI